MSKKKYPRRFKNRTGWQNLSVPDADYAEVAEAGGTIHFVTTAGKIERFGTGTADEKNAEGWLASREWYELFDHHEKRPGYPRRWKAGGGQFESNGAFYEVPAPGAPSRYWSGCAWTEDANPDEEGLAESDREEIFYDPFHREVTEKFLGSLAAAMERSRAASG